MTTALPLTEAERDLVDQIFAAETTIATAKVNSLAAKTSLMQRLKLRADYNSIDSNDDIELAGDKSVIYLSRDVRQSETNLLELVKRLTKRQMLMVFNVNLKNLLRVFPQLYQQWVRLMYTGNRKFLLARPKPGNLVADDDNADATE